MDDKRTHAVGDLARHIAERFDRNVTQAVNLLRNDEEVRMLLFATVATNILSLCNSLSEDEAPHPLFRNLSYRHRLATLVSVLTHVIADLEPGTWTPQELSDMAAAQREITPRLRLEIAEGYMQ
jgi:hypothetical protein